MCVRGDKNDVKRYSSEIGDLCKPLARTEADFMECVFAEFIATVADQALSGSAKKAKKDKAKKTPSRSPSPRRSRKASLQRRPPPRAAAAHAAARRRARRPRPRPDAKRITMNAAKKQGAGMRRL